MSSAKDGTSHKGPRKRGVSSHVASEELTYEGKQTQQIAGVNGAQGNTIHVRVQTRCTKTRGRHDVRKTDCDYSRRTRVFGTVINRAAKRFAHEG